MDIVLNVFVLLGVTMDGGYAQYVVLKSEAVCCIPDDLDPAETAPLLCAGVTTFSKFFLRCNIRVQHLTTHVDSLRNMDAGPGEIVVVQGIG